MPPLIMTSTTLKTTLHTPPLIGVPQKTQFFSESKQLTELMQHCKFFDCYTKFQPQNRKHTFFSENSSLRIDCVYATDDINAISARVSPNQFSDHDTVIAHFDIPFQVSRVKDSGKILSRAIKTKLFTRF